MKMRNMAGRIPYYPTKWEVLKRITRLYTPRPGDRVVELGSGDARVIRYLARSFDDITATGVEINPVLVSESRKRVERERLEGRVEIVMGDLFSHPLDCYDVVYAYLTPNALLRLRDRLAALLLRGGRVVTLDYRVPGLEPVDREEVHTPGRRHVLYLYTSESVPLSLRPSGKLLVRRPGNLGPPL